MLWANGGGGGGGVGGSGTILYNILRKDLIDKR